jgi:hypothetical protein
VEILLIFWEEECLFNKLPHLVIFAKRTDQTVQQVIHMEFLQDSFHLPLSQQAFQEFEKLEKIYDNALIKVQNGLQDKWGYISSDTILSSHKAYKVLIGHRRAL